MKILVITSRERAARAELVHLHLAGHQVERLAGGAVDAGAAVDLLTAVKRADLVVALVPGDGDTYAAIGMAIAAGKPAIAWAEGEAFGAAACSHPLVHQLRGDLGLPSNRDVLAHQVEVVLESHRAGELGRGAWGHARAVARRLGGPTA